MENGTAQPGIRVAERLRRNRKITITTTQTVSTSVNSTSRMELRMEVRGVEGGCELHRGRNLAAEFGQQLLDVVHHFHGVGAGLVVDGQKSCRARR